MSTIDPDAPKLAGYLRRSDRLIRIGRMSGYVSPRLGIKFQLVGDALTLTAP